MRDKITGMPENFGGLEWKDTTNLHPLGLSVCIGLGFAMLFLPRRWTVLPMLIVACLISSVQKIVIFSLDFNLLRVMVLFGIARVILHNEAKNFEWKPIDKIIILWVISGTIINSFMEGSLDVCVNCLGRSFDVIGMYFLFRCLIRDINDVDQVVLCSIWVAIPVAVAFLIEQSTGRNIFSIFGGVPSITRIREGRLRCQGAFSHAILAGCFWASLLPLMAARWWKGLQGKIEALVGIIASFVIIICCASSTPIMAVLFSIVGCMMFFLRNYMRLIRWGILLLLVALHLVMNKPVWHLVARIDIVGGSTGYHRYHLIDQAIKHFDEWFLIGTPSTQNWDGLFDITNQYILEGVKGGLLTMLLFLGIIIYAFRGVGKLMKVVYGKAYSTALTWALGVSLFVHCMNFLGVSYFGQIYMIWYLLLAIIGSLTPVVSNRPSICGNKYREC